MCQLHFRQLRTRNFEHLRRLVHAANHVPALRQVRCPAPGAARGIQDVSRRIALQNWTQDSVFEVDERVVIGIVRARPHRVAVAGGRSLPVLVRLERWVAQ